MVQWLGLGAFTAWTQVQSPVGKLKSHKLYGTAEKKKKSKFYKHIKLNFMPARTRAPNFDRCQKRPFVPGPK